VRYRATTTLDREAKKMQKINVVIQGRQPLRMDGPTTVRHIMERFQIKSGTLLVDGETVGEEHQLSGGQTLAIVNAVTNG
jgi:sulfur carrier protein ThiS